MLNFDTTYHDLIGRNWELSITHALLLGAYGLTSALLTYGAYRKREREERRKTVMAAHLRLILPEKFVTVPEYDVAAMYLTALSEQEVGGYLYDFYPLGAGTYGLIIGDVRRRGTDAAASTSLLRYSVRALSSTGAGPAEVLCQLNDLIEDQVNSYVREQTRPFGTASLFFGLLHAQTGILRYASAGHEPPLLRQSGGLEEILAPTGPVLGIGPGQIYEERLITLLAGDALLLLTDGVTAANNRRAEELGTDGLWKMLRPALLMPTTSMILAWLQSALVEFTGKNHCNDLAMVLVRREAPEDIPTKTAEKTTVVTHAPGMTPNTKPCLPPLQASVVHPHRPRAA